MVKGLYTSYTGMVNEQHRLDTVANSIANFDTNGFKKEGATSQAFDDVLAYKIKDVTEAGNLPRRMGIINPGVKIGENYVDWSEGSFKETGNTFDLAIAGTGFFTIEFTNKKGETSTKYTRDGSFCVDQTGMLRTPDGDYVLNGNGQRIRLDPLQEATINRAGQIYQNNALVGTIGITDFENYDYLEKYGENMYQPVEGAAQRPGNYQIYSGYLEQSNVSIVDEMVNMISIQRSYEANQKLIQTFDSSLETATQLGRL